MTQTIVLIVAGLLGSALKAWISVSQANISKRSIADVILGGAVGGLFPLLVQSMPSPIPELWVRASLVQEALLLGILAYATSDFINNALGKLGVGISAVSLRANGTGGGTTLRTLLIATALIPLFFLSSCASTSTGQGDVAQRVLADLACVTAGLGAGLQIAGDPALGGAKTAIDVLNAIEAVGTSNVPTGVLAACKDTLNYAQQDFAGLIAMVKGATGSGAKTVTPPAQRKAAARAFQQPPRPTVVSVPIRG